MSYMTWEDDMPERVKPEENVEAPGAAIPWTPGAPAPATAHRPVKGPVKAKVEALPTKPTGRTPAARRPARMKPARKTTASTRTAAKRPEVRRRAG
jgi:hypothetical protein